MTFGLYVENDSSRIQIDSENYTNHTLFNSGTFAAGASWPPTTWDRTTSLLYGRPVIPASPTYPLTQHISGASYTAFNGSLTAGPFWYERGPSDSAWKGAANYAYKQYRTFSALSASYTSNVGLQVFNSSSGLVYDSRLDETSLKVLGIGTWTGGQINLGTFTNLDKIYVFLGNTYHSDTTWVVSTPISSAFVVTRFFLGYKYVWTSATSGTLYAVSEVVGNYFGITPVTVEGQKYLFIQEV